MIFWIIFFVISLITGVAVIAFSGDSEEVPEEVPEEEPLPTASLAVTGQWLPPGASDPCCAIDFYSFTNSPLIRGRTIVAGVPTLNPTVTITPTFTGGTAILSMSLNPPTLVGIGGAPAPTLTITPDPGTLTLTSGTPYTFVMPVAYTGYDVLVTFTLTVTSPSGQIATTPETIRVIIPLSSY